MEVFFIASTKNCNNVASNMRKKELIVYVNFRNQQQDRIMMEV